jgi:hypothetical protein
MNFRRLVSAASVVLASLLMIAQTIQNFGLNSAEAREAKAAKLALKTRKANRPPSK